MIVHAYRSSDLKERDAYVLDMISTLLSDGKSSRLYKKLVDDEKIALQVAAINFSQEDYGSYITLALPMSNTPLETLTQKMDEEIIKLQTELISEREFEKLQNIYRNNFVTSNATVAGIANSLARSEEHTSELQSRPHLVCRLLLEKKKDEHIFLTGEETDALARAVEDRPAPRDWRGEQHASGAEPHNSRHSHTS